MFKARLKECVLRFIAFFFSFYLEKKAKLLAERSDLLISIKKDVLNFLF